jgi:4-hydroxybenzoate polyprenyltransferase
MIREYLKLARISIAPLTGLAPVMGAIAIGQYQILHLIIIFSIGILGHAYGMTHNDIMDYTIDKKLLEIADRPLINKTISIKQAWTFSIGCLFLMFALVVVLALSTATYLPILILVIPIFCVTFYNIYSKKIPFADFFLSIGMFFFILYGAFSQQFIPNNLPLMVWIICILGGIQMLSINIVQGGFKDVENDAHQGAKTGAMVLGLNITKNEVHTSNTFKFAAYGMQFIIIGVAYLPFILIHDFTSSSTLFFFILGLVSIVGISTIYITRKYLTLSCFNRAHIRMLFNLQGYINFTLAPILLASITPFALLIIPIPGIGFFLTTFLFHEKFMQPASM